MAVIIIFTIGYLFGGVSALVIVALAVAARRGDRGPAPRVPMEEAVAAWRKDG
jgi:hypothetical protein